MSGEFITAFNLDTGKAIKSLDGQTYACVCGLSLGVSVENLPLGNPVLRRPALLKAAHRRHHDNHFGTPATLYMVSGRTPSGIEILAVAQCSCEYEAENPDFFGVSRTVLDA